VREHQTDLLDAEQVAELVCASHASSAISRVVRRTGEVRTSAGELALGSASLNLLNAFASSGERVVMAGSCIEYDWEYESYCSRVDTASASTLYGSCKHASRPC